MADFQSQIAAALKGRKANENAGAIDQGALNAVKGSFWFYHVFFHISGKNSVTILPRAVAIEHMKDPDKYQVLEGNFGTIAVDDKGRFGFILCSYKENYSRYNGRSRSLTRLLEAQYRKNTSWNNGPKNFYGGQLFKLEEDVLPDAVAEALAKFLQNGNKSRS